MPTLYHYSPLMHLPLILTHGLSRGEIVHPHRYVNAQAVSLTTQTDPTRLACWGERTTFPPKAAVRYVCRLEDGDPKLEQACQTWKRLGVPAKSMSMIDPLGQSKWWSFYHGTIPIDRITIQLRTGNGYIDPTSEQLADVVRAVQCERDRYEFFPHPEMPSILCMARKDEDMSDEWLPTEAYPADRFHLAA